MSDNGEHEGIEDTSNGRCTAGVNIEGQDLRCDYGIHHDGWAHSSRAAQALWQESANWGDDD